MSDWVQKQMERIHGEDQQTAEKGGPGSGHHGHAGRPGKVGGSAPDDGGMRGGGDGGQGASFAAGPYRGYRISGEQRLPTNVLNEDSTVMYSPDGDLLVVPGRKVAHANVVGELGDTSRFDRYVRGDVLKQWSSKTGLALVLMVQSMNLGIGEPLSEGAAMDRRAEKGLGKLARAMIRAGYPESTGVIWRLADGNPLEDLTLADMKAMKTLGYWSQYK